MIEVWILTILIVNTGREWVSPHQYASQEVCEAVGEMTIELAKATHPSQPLQFKCQQRKVTA